MIECADPISKVPYEILSHADQPCGKLFKKYLQDYYSTKHRLSWKFKIQGEVHELICTVSKLSGKRIVTLDGKSLIQGKNQSTTFQFQYPFKGLYLRLFVYGENGQLYIERDSSVKRRHNTYNDYFLVLENKYSGEVTDVYGEQY